MRFQITLMATVLATLTSPFSAAGQGLKTAIGEHAAGRTFFSATFVKSDADGTFNKEDALKMLELQKKKSVTLDELLAGAGQYRPNYTYSWPGVYFEGQFTGSQIDVHLDDTPNIYNLTIDDKAPIKITRPADLVYEVRNLSDSQHIIRLEKITESSAQPPEPPLVQEFEGTTYALKASLAPGQYSYSIDGAPMSRPFKSSGRVEMRFDGLAKGKHNISIRRVDGTAQANGSFKGFYVATSAQKIEMHARSRQIEFIGDSYTVGYGNTSPKRQCTQEEIWATTDNSQAFGPLTAKHYNADYQINAISGRGIVRNYGGGGGAHLPEAYPYVLFDQKTEYKDPSWQPQIIVIGLGTNDFTTPLHDGEKWKTRGELHADYEKTYVAFVQALRAKNPKASFILMATDQVDGEIQSEVKKVIASLAQTGETRVTFIPMNGLSFTGCDWHPSTADDQIVSQSLISYIDAHADLWLGQ